MNTLIDIAKAYFESETAKRREKADARLSQLKETLKPGGDFRLIQPGVLPEACRILLEEARQLGLDVVDHVLQHPEARPQLNQTDAVESFRRFMYDWATGEQAHAVMASFQAFLDGLGIKVDQEVLTARQRAAEQMAQAAKEYLIKIHRAARPARAA
jgi:hypothetical protein